MITSWLVALVALALALLIQRVMLARRAAKLKAVEQAFRFHAIRDELQTLALQRVVDQDSAVYGFVMYTANLCIRNAGVIKLRDTLRVARTVDSQVKGENAQQFLREIKRQPDALQRLVGETFVALAEILVANDYIVRAGLTTAVLTARAWKAIRPVLQWFTEGVDTVARLVAPRHAEAVKYARKYHDWGGRFAAAA